MLRLPHLQVAATQRFHNRGEFMLIDNSMNTVVMGSDYDASLSEIRDHCRMKARRAAAQPPFLNLRFAYKQGLHQQRQRLQTRWNPRPQPPNPRQAAFCTGLFCFDWVPNPASEEELTA
jgi:hypothetical protein